MKFNACYQNKKGKLMQNTCIYRPLQNYLFTCVFFFSFLINMEKLAKFGTSNISKSVSNTKLNVVGITQSSLFFDTRKRPLRVKFHLTHKTTWIIMRNTCTLKAMLPSTTAPEHYRIFDLLGFRFRKNFLPLPKHILVHMRTAWDIDHQAYNRKIEVIEREVPRVWHPYTVLLRILNVWQSKIY